MDFPRLALMVGIALALSNPIQAAGIDTLREAVKLEQDGQQNEALEAFTAAIAATDLTPAQRGFAFYRRGSIWGAVGENLKGIADFTRSIESNSAYGEAYSLRGYLRGVIGQYDLAERDHVQAAKLAGNSTFEFYVPWVLQHHADLWRRRGNFENALDYCQRALAAKEYAVVYFRRAWIYLDMGRAASAKAEFEKFHALQKQVDLDNNFWPDERAAYRRLSQLR